MPRYPLWIGRRRIPRKIRVQWKIRRTGIHQNYRKTRIFHDLFEIWLESSPARITYRFRARRRPAGRWCLARNRRSELDRRFDSQPAGQAAVCTVGVARPCGCGVPRCPFSGLREGVSCTPLPPSGSRAGRCLGGSGLPGASGARESHRSSREPGSSREIRESGPAPVPLAPPATTAPGRLGGLTATCRNGAIRPGPSLR